jgi:hypothetical protein
MCGSREAFAGPISVTCPIDLIERTTTLVPVKRTLTNTHLQPCWAGQLINRSVEGCDSLAAWQFHGLEPWRAGKNHPLEISFGIIRFFLQTSTALALSLSQSHRHRPLSCFHLQKIHDGFQKPYNGG